MPFGAFAPLPIRLGGSATEGWAPEQHARVCADLVAVKRTAPLAKLSVSQLAGSPFTAAVTSYHGQNGAGLTYAPSITTNGVGDITLTWPAYWTDEFGIQHALKLRQAVVTGAETTCRFHSYIIAARTIRIRSFNDAGVATSSALGIKVW